MKALQYSDNLQQKDNLLRTVGCIVWMLLIDNCNSVVIEKNTQKGNRQPKTRGSLAYITDQSYNHTSIHTVKLIKQTIILTTTKITLAI